MHGVDVEGLRAGIEDGLVALLGAASPIPCTYAGGVRDIADLERIRVRVGCVSWLLRDLIYARIRPLWQELGCGRVNATIGSALDIFGGSLPYADVVRWSRSQQPAPVAASSGESVR